MQSAENEDLGLWNVRSVQHKKAQLLAQAVEIWAKLGYRLSPAERDVVKALARVLSVPFRAT